ncbi:MAG: [protein-PII] uridylyltransferase, partial [Actinobacteria bacterium]|nr:[protein-PII] uridylyltransferase [Actinomycetota bacterium]
MGTRERRYRSNESDRYLASLFKEALAVLPPKAGQGGIALAAVGGYGRAELSPGSDLDILILHNDSFSESELSEFVNKLLYPMWDTKSVDHSVRTRTQTRDAAHDDLKVALGLLDIRLVSGDADLVAAVQHDSIDSWRKESRKRLPQLRLSLEERHERAGELAYLLEPDLKE